MRIIESTHIGASLEECEEDFRRIRGRTYRYDDSSPAHGVVSSPLF